MKKILFVAMMCLISTFVIAQNDHLKFSGIPLDGTVSQFHNKIIQKGYKYDAEMTKRLTGGRAYVGVFAGEQSDIYVYYDLKTSKVYRVKVVISSLSESLAKQKFESMVSRLKNKYTENNSLYDDSKDSNFVDSYLILPLRDKYNEFLTAWGNSYGGISIFITESADKYNYPYHYSLHIDYEDQLNSDAHRKSIEDDL